MHVELRDHIDRRPAETARPNCSFGIRVARLVDRYRRFEREDVVPEAAEMFNSDAPQGEAFATLRLNLTARKGGSSNRTILIGSAEPHAGKSTVAARLGTAMARCARRVVLVGADLRRPRLHRIFGLSDDTGLLVVRDGHSSRDGNRDAQEHLEAVRARNLGVVVQCSGHVPPAFHSSYRPGVPV
jgi:Mrp family chromosome partitioning ATPase